MKFDHYSIRIIRQQDAPAYFELVEANRPRLEDFFAGTVAKTKTPAATETFVSDTLARNQNKEYYPFTVTDTRTGKIIGFIDVKHIDWNIPKAELGCFIDAAYAGQGISQRALQLVITHLMNELGFVKLFLRTHQNNAEARNLAQKCGFQVEGTIRKDYKTTKGELVDLVYYGLVKDNTPD